VFSSGSSTRAVLDRFFEEVGIVPNIQLEVENDEAAERALVNGVGACFLPIGRVSHDRIHYIRVQGHRIMREVALVCPHGSAACVSAFLALCKDHATCAGSAA
jgi:DNA-binding transcriptional LysR family regulator